MIIYLTVATKFKTLRHKSSNKPQVAPIARVLAMVTICFAMYTDNCLAQPLRVLVPAYGNPCCDGGPQLWKGILQSAKDPNRNFELHVILNPASGPATSIDPNYIDDHGNGPLVTLKQTNAKIYGYVGTSYSKKAIEGLKKEIDAYVTGHYKGYVCGIFFDEMSSDLANVGYYQELSTYAKRVLPNAVTFGNPGTTYTENPSSQTKFSMADFARSVDVVMSFENSAALYKSGYTPPAYLNDKEASGFAHVIHSQATWDVDLLSTFRQRKAGWIYVTDDIFLANDPTTNPYDSLPSYWNQFTSDLSAFNLR